jgi:queuine tRNA-ribosyltransferase
MVTYDNGTSSLLEKASGETMHSRIGPWQEARILYVEQSELVSRLKSLTDTDPVILHDVGMGIAANAIAAVHHFEELLTAQRNLELHSFETDLSGLRIALQNPEKFPFLLGYEEVVQELLRNRIYKRSLGGCRLTWKLHEGDYFKNLNKTPPPELIFYDFYAPKAYPELWTPQCFRQIREHLENRLSRGRHTELYTYSASTAVRAALLASGFYVGYGPSTELKLETTVASTNILALKRPLDQRWVEKLERSCPTAISTSEWNRLKEKALINDQFS